MKIGDIITINGTKLLILDLIEGNPFVIAFDLDISTHFSKDSINDYRSSRLRTVCDDWFANFTQGEKTIPIIPRALDLTTMDGSKDYGVISVRSAPLTFDEWRKYSEVITLNTQQAFWLATGWTQSKWDNDGDEYVCSVSSYGQPYYTYDYISLGLVPAFIIDKSYFTTPSFTLSAISTEDLLNELQHRTKA